MISQNNAKAMKTMARILCIEDNVDFYMYLAAALKEHNLTHATSLNDSFKLVQNGRESFDLILLDISLPDGNGIKAISALKENFPLKNVPVIILSSDGDVLSKVAAFGFGADDYVQKPPELSELKARIQARLRGSHAEQKNKNFLQVGDLAIDSDKMSVEHSSASGKKNIELTPSEFKLLKLLCSRPSHVYTRDQLIDQVWGISKYITQRTVDAHISHLRKKLNDSNVRIETVLSVGYKVEVKDNA